MPVCATPGCLRDTGADWKDLCPRCYARKRESEERGNPQAQIDKLYLENQELRAALRQALAENTRLLGGGGKASPIPEEVLRLLLQLCHPDKHGNSPASNKATAWLNKQRG